MGGTLVWSGSLGVEQGVRHAVSLGMSSSEQLVETSKVMGGTLVWSETLGVEHGVRHVVSLGMSSSEQLVETLPAQCDCVKTRASGTVGKVANGALKYVA